MNTKMVLIVALVLSINFLVMIGCAKNRLPSPTPAPASLAPSAESVGKQLFFEKGCVACHKVNGEGGEVGPSLAGIMGETVELSTGEKLVRGHEYFEESLHNPDARIVKGYQAGIMPKFDLTHEEIHELEDFIKSLRKTR